MDNLTHTLTGLALARAGLNRFSPQATLLLILAANIPDIDIVTLGGGQLSYLEHHRGYTHSLLLLPVMAALSVAITAAICRHKLPWVTAWALAAAGVASHLLLDWTNSYGVRLLLPFSARWYFLDLNSLTDFVILGVLILAAVWPLFGRLVGSEIGERRRRFAGRGVAIFALAFFASYDGARAILHARAGGQLEARLYDGVPPVRAAALPEALNPFLWRGIVETANSYLLLPVNTLGDIDPASGEQFFKLPVTRAIQAVREREPFRYFLYFARFPVWSVEPAERGGTRVTLTDLRFGTPESSAFHCTALENGNGNVVEARFGF
jgi:inner membrane protein